MTYVTFEGYHKSKPVLMIGNLIKFGIKAYMIEDKNLLVKIVDKDLSDGN